jgi:GrpB-like predicted nucleotidyltransferase (UPF0157 family)
MDPERMNKRWLGLRRGTVRLEAHNNDWALAYKQLAHELTAIGEPLGAEVEHVGSTAVPDLPAKAIIDVVIGVPADNKTRLLKRLGDAGYIDRGNKGDQGGHLFVAAPPEDQEFRLAHIHVVDLGSDQWLGYLRFRDLLRADPEVRRRYGELKRRKASQFAENRASYTTAKESFISSVLERR